MLENAKPQKFIPLFNSTSKGELEKQCRNLVVDGDDLVALILAGQAGVLAPYKYACHFSEKVGNHLQPSGEELQALSENGIGPLTDKAKKLVSKTFQLFKERRSFAAHLFYTPDYKHWYLIYLDQRDTAKGKNHWAHGPHIHIVSSHWPNLTLEQAWSQALAGDMNFANKIHLRYIEPNIPDAS